MYSARTVTTLQISYTIYVTYWAIIVTTSLTYTCDNVTNFINMITLICCTPPLISSCKINVEEFTKIIFNPWDGEVDATAI